MNDISTFGIQDISIIIVSILVGIIFTMFFADKLFKFYLGIIVGFLLFLVFNCQIDILEQVYGRELTTFQNFLVQHKSSILNTLSLLIPILGIFFALNPFKKGGFLSSLLMATLLPLFILGVLGYIVANSVVSLPFLENILGFISNSFLFDFLLNNSHYIFLALLFILFYKAIFALLWAFLVWLFHTLWVAFFGEKEEDEEEYYEEDEYEDEE